MPVFSASLLLVVLCVLFLVIDSQQQSEQSQDTQTRQVPASPAADKSPLTREIIESIFQQLSPGCRAEMEAVMETAQSHPPPTSDSESGLSAACTEEIQRSAQRVAGSVQDNKTPNKRTSTSASSRGAKESTAQQAENEASAAAAKQSSSQSVILVVAALMVLFGAVIGYAVYVNANLNQQGSQKKTARKKDKKSR